MRCFKGFDSAFILWAEYVAVLYFFKEVVLDEVALFAAGAIKEEDSAILSDTVCHIGFLSWDYYLSVFVDATEVTSKPTFSLVSSCVYYEYYFTFVWG